MMCPHHCQKRIRCVLSDASVFNSLYKSLAFSTSILVVAESVTPVTTNILGGGSQRVNLLHVELSHTIFLLSTLTFDLGGGVLKHTASREF